MSYQLAKKKNLDFVSLDIVYLDISISTKREEKMLGLGNFLGLVGLLNVRIFFPWPYCITLNKLHSLELNVPKPPPSPNA